MISAFSGLRQKANEDRVVAIRRRLTFNGKALERLQKHNALAIEAERGYNETG